MYFTGIRALVYPKVLKLGEEAKRFRPRPGVVELYFQLAMHLLGQDENVRTRFREALGESCEDVFGPAVGCVAKGVDQYFEWAIRADKLSMARKVIGAIERRGAVIREGMLENLIACSKLDIDFTLKVLREIPVVLGRCSDLHIHLRMQSLNLHVQTAIPLRGEKATLKNALRQLQRNPKDERVGLLRGRIDQINHCLSIERHYSGDNRLSRSRQARLKHLLECLWDRPVNNSFYELLARFREEDRFLIRNNLWP